MFGYICMGAKASVPKFGHSSEYVGILVVIVTSGGAKGSSTLMGVIVQCQGHS